MVSRPEILGSPLDEILACARAIERKADQELRRRGLTMSRYLVLRAVELSRGRATHGDLLRWLPVTQPTLACHVKALSARGLLRSIIGKDKRERLLQLTPDGVGLLKQIFSPVYWNLKFSAESPEELSAFSSRMEEFRNDLEGQMAEAGMARTRVKTRTKKKKQGPRPAETPGFLQGILEPAREGSGLAG